MMKELARFVLGRDPGDAHAQKLLFRLTAHDETEHKIAAKSLSRNPELCEDLQVALAQHPDGDVRREFWRRSTETDDSGRSRFGRYPTGNLDLAAELIAREPDDVLRHRMALTVPGVPSTRVLPALRWAWSSIEEGSSVRAASWDAVQADRDTAIEVAGDATLPPHLLVAAAACPQLDPEEALLVLETAIHRAAIEGRTGLSSSCPDRLLDGLGMRVNVFDEHTLALFETAAQIAWGASRTESLARVYRARYLAVREGTVPVDGLWWLPAVALIDVAQLLPEEFFTDLSRVSELTGSIDADQRVVEAVGRRGVDIDDPKVLAELAAWSYRRNEKATISWLARWPEAAAEWLVSSSPSWFPGGLKTLTAAMTVEEEARLADALIGFGADGTLTPDRGVEMLRKVRLSVENIHALPASALVKYLEGARVDTSGQDDRILEVVTAALAVLDDPLTADPAVFAGVSGMLNELAATGANLHEAVLAATALTE